MSDPYPSLAFKLPFSRAPQRPCLSEWRRMGTGPGAGQMSLADLSAGHSASGTSLRNCPPWSGRESPLSPALWLGLPQLPGLPWPAQLPGWSRPLEPGSLLYSLSTACPLLSPGSSYPLVTAPGQREDIQSLVSWLKVSMCMCVYKYG